MGGAERAEPLMERTYIILRRYLNRMPAPAMLEVKEEWPFLFSQRGLFSHFGLLTDVNILQQLQEALGQRGQTILQFCQKLDNPKIREVLATTAYRSPWAHEGRYGGWGLGAADMTAQFKEMEQEMQAEGEQSCLYTHLG
ncbi:Sterile alpha motif domain containing protein 3 [Dissostichus eleginoides]|uniref:Sterile alpha motif domain containing protein 3 n=1 Tax=Dissostichus eleginoides TaxID=100907 RepID=A0AAD9CQH4_DISEL|nr:Sterile alpha motif domain containing protein 3 [Dissostichus eleginoides]